MSFDIFDATKDNPRRFRRGRSRLAAIGASMQTQMNAILLLVEDEALLSMEIQDALTDGGFEVMLAKDGAEAFKLLENHGHELRGLVTDINLGNGPKGWDVARRARELMPDLPIVYMSGESGSEWTSLGVPKSVFVAKPFAPAQIVTAVSTLINEAGPIKS